jgi:hypothetical protein
VRCHATVHALKTLKANGRQARQSRSS